MQKRRAGRYDAGSCQDIDDDAGEQAYTPMTDAIGSNVLGTDFAAT